MTREEQMQQLASFKAQFVAIVISIFIAPVISSVFISFIFMELSMFLPVLMFCWIGTLIIGVPVSIVLERAVRSVKRGKFVLSLLLHSAAGALVVALYVYYAFASENGSNAGGGFGGIEWFMCICGLINALVYCLCLYAFRSWAVNRRVNQQSNETSN
ncbi:hypothetical protein [Paenibacillus herberti]|uniref:Transmembrane protein n=1 Tax=Paenibacillus herberti TaxID=1619309 RepID=A0A229NV25_9BACL|nr:hypothetical protein [Paenibacillus herberti]OXM13585.1 hypothetical protein CGZ75_21380 [Paenibacillus herberti]